MLPGYSLIQLFLQSRPEDGDDQNTLLMIKINPTCKRLLSFICQEKAETWLVLPISQ